MQETRENPVQEEEEESLKKKMRRGACGWLRDQKVGDLVLHKRRLVEVPYTATLADTINALVANGIVAAPVAAPPGRWIGAGGSMILESDRATGVVRKQYIGMVTMMDVLVHIAEVDEGAGAVEAEPNVEKKMSVPVYEVIGHSLEGLSLWTLNPSISILDCMETFSKGVHRALVPLESHAENVIAAELVETSPGYRMLTQMDVLTFLRKHSNELKDVISRSVRDLGAVNENIFAVTQYSKVIEAIKSMRTASLSAVPIVEVPQPPGDAQFLQDGKGKRVLDTFSATDLRGCSIAQLQSWLSIDVVEFKQRVSLKASAGHNTTDDPSPTMFRKLVTCYHDMSLSEVIDEAIEGRVHRVWVVDREGLLQGLVSLTDMLRIIREAVLHADHELRGDVNPNESTSVLRTGSQSGS